MKVYVRGYRPVHYTKKDTDNVVDGIELSYTHKSSNWFGECGGTTFIKSGNSFYKTVSDLANSDRLISALLMLDFNVERIGNKDVKTLVELEVLEIAE